MKIRRLLTALMLGLGKKRGKMLGKKAMIGTTLVIVLLILGATRTAIFDKRALAAVDLASFTATGGDGQVLLEWETASEIDNIGFNLWCSTSQTGDYAKLNDSLIPSKAPGSVIGAHYSYTDSYVINGTTYYYKLEDVDVYGHSDFHGPILAIPGVQPTATPSPPTATPTPFPTPAPTPTLTPPIGCGMAVASVDDQTLELVEQAGFEWVLYYASWAQAEPFPGWYDWAWLNDALAQCEKHGLKIVMRVDRPPAWANGGGGTTAPPTDPTYLGSFMHALVSHFGHRVRAYVIWNEPNLAAEWGGQAPDAAQYAGLLQAAYEGAKAADPAVTIVSAGLAPTNDNSPVAVDDRIYLQEMYHAGVADYFDILGANPMGFASSPDDTSDPNHFYFSRVTELRDIMVTNGDSDKQIWALEFGWLHDTEVDLGDFNWMKVSPQEQADYLVRAYQKALEEWPWMGVMFVWNLDFSAHYPDTSHQYWFSIINEDYTPRPAYLALKEMTRWAHVNPPSLDVTLGWGETVTRTLTISNTGWADLTFEIGEQLGSLMPTTVAAGPLNLPRAAEALGGRFTPSEGDQPPSAPVPPAAPPVLSVLTDRVSPSAQIQTGQYYITTEDNEDNYHTGNPDGDMDVGVCGGNWNEPIEFNIFVDGVVGPTGNALTIRAYDVDYPTEVDEVRFNGVYLGDLAGYGDIWSETVFDIPASVVVPGPNLVEIDITSSDWCMTVDWGQLFVSGAPVPWLDETPKSGSIPSSSSQDITVTFDATGVQPGEHLASILVSSNDPATSLLNVPVTMTVLPTANMGWAEGTVTDAVTSDPLEATIVALGQPYTVTTNPDTGYYKLWLEAGNYTLQASAAGYVTETAVVSITAQQGITQNFALVLNVPVLEVSPESLQVTHYVGDMTTQALTMTNAGPAPLEFELAEYDTTPGLMLLEAHARTDDELAALMAEAMSVTDAHNQGQPTIARFPTEAFHQLQGTTRILAWTAYTDYWEEYQNSLNAIAQHTTYSLAETTTTDPATLSNLLADADVFLVPEQEFNDYWTLYNIGTTWAGVLADFVATGGTVVVMDHCNQTIGLVEGAALMHLMYEGCTTSSMPVEVVAPDHPLAEGVPATFVGMNGTGYYSYTDGQEIVRIPPPPPPGPVFMTVVAVRDIGAGHVVVMGFDFYNYNDDMARLLANAVLWYGGGDVPWLSEDPITGTVSAYSSTPVQVTFDATGLQPDTYTAEIVVRSNDPVTPSASIPVTMTVNPTADMGRVTGTVSDAWTGLPLTATVELIGVYSMTASPDYTIWAPAGTHILAAYASGYVTTYRPVAIPAGGLVTENLALEPAQPRLEWAPTAVSATAVEGDEITRTLMISNTGPLPLDIALHEINPTAALQTLSSSDLAGKRILYDRAHGEPASSDYSSLVNDAISAGAMITENWYFPVDAAVLEGYDVLWVNCCGGITWGFSELNAVNTWLNAGGAVFVQGESSPSTSGPASIFGIYYVSGSCTSGTTTSIVEHPISEGVSAVNVEWTCWRLAPGSGVEIVVFDPQGQPHVVAQEQSGGKMVVVASEDFSDWHIENDDNRLLGNNILAWLARPAYSDVPWLSETPEEGTIPGHSSLPVTLGFDATTLSPGDYQATLAIEHNDPAQPSPIEVPVTLTVALPKWELFLPLILKNSD